MADIKLWGFQGSTYARTVRMVLAEKGVVDYEQTEVNVLAGEPRSEAHRLLHPFGKVPVVEIDGMRLIETSAIARYLDARLPGRDLVPADIKARARMDMAISIVDAYGYAAIVGGVAAYHLFPDFVGGKDDDKLRAGVQDTMRTLTALMGIRGASPYLAGDDPTLADLYLAPLVGLLEAVPERGDFMRVEGLAQWWSQISNRGSFRSTM